MFTRIFLSSLLLVSSFIFLTGCSKSGDPGKSFGPSIESSQYMKYDATKVQTSLDTGNDVVIFVGATRCPPCMALHKDIEANIDQIPETITIYAADYDIHEELIQKYNITAKHTSLYLSSDGEAIINSKAKDYKLDQILETVSSLKE